MWSFLFKKMLRENLKLAKVHPICFNLFCWMKRIDKNTILWSNGLKPSIQITCACVCVCVIYKYKYKQLVIKQIPGYSEKF